MYRIIKNKNLLQLRISFTGREIRSQKIIMGRGIH